MWPKVWLGKPLKIEKKQEGAVVKPNARRLRGMFSSDPNDHACQETMKNAREKLERPMVPAMLCKRKSTECFWKQKLQLVASPQNLNQFGCMVESHESARPVKEKHHEDHIAGPGATSTNHFNLVRKFIQMPKVIKIPDAKEAVDKEWKKLATIPELETGEGP